MKYLIFSFAIVAVVVAHPSISAWTLEEIKEAVENPNLNPQVAPTLQFALETFQHLIAAGIHLDHFMVALPVGVPIILDPVESSPVLPSPPESSSPEINPEPVAPEILPSEPVAPEILPSEPSPPDTIPSEPSPPVPSPPSPSPPAPSPPALGPVVVPAISSPLVQLIINVNNQQVPDSAPYLPENMPTLDLKPVRN